MRSGLRPSYDGVIDPTIIVCCPRRDDGKRGACNGLFGIGVTGGWQKVVWNAYDRLSVGTKEIGRTIKRDKDVPHCGECDVMSCGVVEKDVAVGHQTPEGVGGREQQAEVRRADLDPEAREHRLTKPIDGGAVA